MAGAEQGRGHLLERLRLLTPKDRILLLAICVLTVVSTILWRENRRKAQYIRVLEAFESIRSRRMLEIQEERLRLERMQFFRLP